MFYLVCDQQRLAQTQSTVCPHLVLLPLGPRLKGHQRSGLRPFQAYFTQCLGAGPWGHLSRQLLFHSIIHPPSLLRDGPQDA